MALDFGGRKGGRHTSAGRPKSSSTKHLTTANELPLFLKVPSSRFLMTCCAAAGRSPPLVAWRLDHAKPGLIEPLHTLLASAVSRSLLSSLQGTLPVIVPPKAPCSDVPAEPADQQVLVFGAVVFDVRDGSASFSWRLRGQQ
jgi:hypothetical protein